MDLLENWIVPPEALTGPLAYALAMFAALFFVSVDKGGLGGGVGIVSVPLLMQVAPVKFVIGMWLPVLVVCDFCTIRSYPSQWRFGAVKRLVPGVLLAVAGTSIALNMMNLEGDAPQAKQLQAWLKLSVAVISIVYLMGKMRPAPDEALPPWQPTWTMSWIVGVLGGITTTIAHAAGPIVTMYLLPQKLERREYVGTAGRFYFALNSLKIPSFIAIGLVNVHSLRYGLWLMVLSPFGVWLGSWLNRKISAVWFVRVLHFSLVLAAGKLAWDAFRDF